MSSLVARLPPTFPLHNQTQVQEVKSRSRCLLRRHLLLFQLDACIRVSEHLMSRYVVNEDHGELYKEC